MPANRPQRPVNRSHRPGATIGDGMVTSARIAGVTAILINGGPMLLAGLGGCLFLFRGCIWSAPHIAQQPRAAVATPAYMPQQMPSVIPVSPREARRQSSRAPLQIAEPSPVAHSDERALIDAVIEPGVPSLDQVEPLRLPQPGGFFAMGPGFNGAANPMPGFPFGNNSIMGMITEPPSASDPPAFEESPLFDLKRGRKFLGTCQMPGSPSKRMSLALGAIREGGRNIEAKLSLLEAPRMTKAFTGVIEQNPLRLTLTPDQHPTSFGTFLTYMPWYSNSPTKITLSIADDGKSLSGTSVASEEFEFLPQERNAEAIRVRRPLPIETFAGFDDASQGSTKWNVKRKGQESGDGTAQLWSFTQISDGEGSFSWFRDGSKIASGTYLENASKKQLDIFLTRGRETLIYRGVFNSFVADEEGVEVCIAKEQGQERPAQITSEKGNVFELMASDSRN